MRVSPRRALPHFEGVGGPFAEPLAEPVIVQAERALSAARARVEVAEARFFRCWPDEQAPAYEAYIHALREEIEATSRLELTLREARGRPPARGLAGSRA